LGRACASSSRSGRIRRTTELWQTILSGRVWHGELVNRRKDGSLYTEEMTITPLHDEGGEISNFIAIKQDISERKRAQETLAERARQAALGRMWVSP